MANSNSLSRAFAISIGVIAVGMVALILMLPTTTRSTEKTTTTSTTLAIVDARVFDGEAWHTNTSILIDDGRISAIGADIDIPEDIRRIDGSGHSVLPGLIDSHVHAFGDALSESLRFGVTTNLDMFTSPDMLPQTRSARADPGATQAADLYSAGMMATIDGGHGTQYGVQVETIDADTNITAWVARRKDEGSDYIKLVYMPYQSRIPSLDLPTASAVIAAAHDADLLAVAHISSARAALDLINADVDGLVHIFADEPASDELVRAAKERDVFVIPTLSVLATADQSGAGPRLAGDPEIKPYLTDAQTSSLIADFGIKVPGMTLDGAIENVRRLHAAGVRILAGSDAPNPGTTYGASLHQELALLMRAGLSTTDALRAATSMPAAAFGLPERGRIAPGQRADLILVEGDAKLDIHATRAMRLVLRNGAEVTRDPDAVVAATLAPGPLSDFSARIGAPEGFAWSATDDRDMQGQSVADIALLAPNVASPSGAVRVEANVRGGFPYPWAGLSFGAADGQPRNLSRASSLSLMLRGTPGPYRIMFFNAGSTGAPPTHTVTVTETWQSFDIQLDQLSGLNPTSVVGIAIVAGPQTGRFVFDVAEVSLN